jgi:hypothetical protein
LAKIEKIDGREGGFLQFEITAILGLSGVQRDVVARLVRVVGGNSDAGV